VISKTPDHRTPDPAFMRTARQRRWRVPSRLRRAVVAGDWVFVSGTTGFDYSSMTIAGGLLEQTEQCIKTIASALQQAGSSLSEVVRVTYVLANGAEFPECWPVLRK
jgi:enamine deaminase RidA (YjgF/YER057c/UK114 family)